jgi:putative tricarboxylic transport membrane protein
MDLLANVALGASVAITPANLALCLLGCLLGTLIGILPGLGPIATISLLLPVTYSMEPVSALIMLAGIYYGAQYGGSTTAILVNLPGEASSVVTALDGYKLAQKGRAGEALFVAAIGSFIAGCFGTLVIVLGGPPLADMASRFASPEYFSLMVLGLFTAVVLANGSVVKAVAMVILGLFLGLVGNDVNSGQPRMTMGFPELSDGVSFVSIALGLLGIAEVARNLEAGIQRGDLVSQITSLWPSRETLRAMMRPVARGSVLGSILGVLPGGGVTVASFAAYALEKRVAREPSRFGNGAIEGVAAPESANNAAAQTSLIPLLTLGIPSSAVMAVMVGAMTMHGIVPSPTVIEKQPALFWGLIVSMFVGNVMLVFINLPMIGMWVRFLRVPYRILFQIILVVSAIGVYSVNNTTFEIYVTAAFGVLGYLFYKFDCEPAPLLLGFVIGPLMEENFRRALILSGGDPTVFFTRPISLALILIGVALLAAVALPAVRKKRDEAFQEDVG